MSHEQKPGQHHHQHHSHARRNWLLPVVCLVMIVGGGYWMNVTSSDPDGQVPVAPPQAGAFGSSSGNGTSGTAQQPEPGMEMIAPPPGQAAVSGLPAGMDPGEPAAGPTGPMGPSRMGATSQTLKR